MANASLGVARLDTRMDLSGLKQGFAEARSTATEAIGGIGKSIDTLGPKMSSIGKTWSLRVTAPIMAMGAGIIKVSADFESSMNRVRAMSGATGESLERLKGQARQLGADTQFSASQAADAMGFLSMAGFSVEEVYRSMPGTLSLAAAAQMDMAESADLASNILTGFGLKADDLGGAVDILAKGFTSSNTDLRMLGEGMKYVAPVASGLGVSLAETTAIIGKLSDAGIQGSMAGTTLTGILDILATKSGELGIATTDAAGNMRPMADILDELNNRGMSTTEALETFGRRAGPGMAALLSQGGDSLRNFVLELEDAGGTAERVASEMQEGFAGQLKELTSALEELTLAFGDEGLLKGATDLAKRVTALLKSFGELPSGTKKAIIGIAGVLAAIGPLSVGIGGILKNIPLLIGGIKGVGVALAFLTTNPIGLIITGIALAVASLTYAHQKGKEEARVWGEILKDNALNAANARLAALGYTGALEDMTQATYEASKAQLQTVINEVAADMVKAQQAVEEAENKLASYSKTYAEKWGASLLGMSSAARAQIVETRQQLEALTGVYAELTGQRTELEKTFNTPKTTPPPGDGDTGTSTGGVIAKVTKELRTVNEVLADYQTAMANATRESALLVSAGLDPITMSTELMQTELNEAHRALTALLTEDLAGSGATEEQLEALANKIAAITSELEKLSEVVGPMAGVRAWTARLGMELDGLVKQPQQLLDILIPKLEELKDEYAGILDGGADWDWDHLLLLEAQIAQIQSTVDGAADAVGEAFSKANKHKQIRPDENEYGGMGLEQRAQHDPWADSQYAAEAEAAEQLLKIEALKYQQQREGRSLMREVGEAQFEEYETLKLITAEKKAQLELDEAAAAFTRGRGTDLVGRMGVQATHSPLENTSNNITSIMHDFSRDFSTWGDGMNSLEQIVQGANGELDRLRAAGEVGSEAWVIQTRRLNLAETALAELTGTVEKVNKELMGSGLEFRDRYQVQSNPTTPATSQATLQAREAQSILFQWTHGLMNSELALEQLNMITSQATLELTRLYEAGRMSSEAFQEWTAVLNSSSAGASSVTGSLDADEAAADLLVDAGTQFQVSVANAGINFASTLAESITSGDAGQAIKGVFDAGGQILQAAIMQAAVKDASSALGALGPWGAVIGAGISLIGGLFTSGSKGGSTSRADEAARTREASQTRSTPSISVTAVMHQQNQFNTGITDPATQYALDKQIRQVVLSTLEAVGLSAVMQKGQVTV